VYLVRLWRGGDRWVVALLRGVQVVEAWTHRGLTGALLRYAYLRARAALGLL